MEMILIAVLTFFLGLVLLSDPFKQTPDIYYTKGNSEIYIGGGRAVLFYMPSLLMGVLGFALASNTIDLEMGNHIFALVVKIATGAVTLPQLFVIANMSWRDEENNEFVFIAIPRWIIRIMCLLEMAYALYLLLYPLF